MSTPYYTDPEVRKLIDIALHQCALIYAKLGTKQLVDENGNKVDDMEDPMQWARDMEIKLLRSVEHLDPEFFEILLNND